VATGGYDYPPPPSRHEFKKFLGQADTRSPPIWTCTDCDNVATQTKVINDWLPTHPRFHMAPPPTYADAPPGPAMVRTADDQKLPQRRHRSIQALAKTFADWSSNWNDNQTVHLTKTANEIPNVSP